MRKAKLWGYTVLEDGTIYGLQNRKMLKNKQIKVKRADKQISQSVSYGRFVYYAFHQRDFNFDDSNVIVKHIDGNSLNCELSNLKAVGNKYTRQGEYNGFAKLTDEQTEEIKRVYHDYKEKKIKKYSPTTKISYRKLAEKYGVSHTVIGAIINGTIRNKQNYILK